MNPRVTTDAAFFSPTIFPTVLHWDHSVIVSDYTLQNMLGAAQPHKLVGKADVACLVLQVL